MNLEIQRSQIRLSYSSPLDHWYDSTPPPHWTHDNELVVGKQWHFQEGPLLSASTYFCFNKAMVGFKEHQCLNSKRSIIQKPKFEAQFFWHTIFANTLNVNLSNHCKPETSLLALWTVIRCACDINCHQDRRWWIFCERLSSCDGDLRCSGKLLPHLWSGQPWHNWSAEEPNWCVYQQNSPWQLCSGGE